MALETVQQLRTTLGFTAPPNSQVLIVDQSGKKFTVDSVTFHDVEGENPYWTSIDVTEVDEEPES